MPSTAATRSDVEVLVGFLRNEYKEAVYELAQHYPKEQRSLYIDYDDLYRWDHTWAEEYLKHPSTRNDDLEEALRTIELPADISLSQAHVRVYNLPEEETYFPGEYSPTRRHEEKPFVALQGQVEQATNTSPTIVEAAFECQRCGTPTYIPQNDTGFQEPHECQGCERQGPFRVDNHESNFVDGQKLRLKEPPERAPSGNGKTIDVYVEDDLCKQADAGDRVVITGTLELEQVTRGQQKTTNFEPYLVGESIEISDTDYDDLDITPEEEERIIELSNDEIFRRARESIATGITGEKYEPIKEAMFLSLIGGERVEFDDGTAVRGDEHILLIGERATGKSTLLEAVQAIAPRSVSASGKGSTVAGLIGAAVQNDFGDAEWTIEGGALVQAHNGVCAMDELDKMDAEVASSMHDALAKQRIPISKAGINTTLQAETTVVAAANPKYERWDEYEDLSDQLGFSGTLLSRFGLVYRLEDEVDPEQDRQMATATVARKEAKKAADAADGAVEQWEDDTGVSPDPSIPHELLRKYIAYAKRQPAPRFRPPSERSDSVSEFKAMIDSYVQFRQVNGQDDDAPIPISARKLEDIHRLAEASARGRLSQWIEEEDIDRARYHVGVSLRQYGQNEDGEFDADATETGTPSTQRDREKTIEKLLKEHEDEYEEAGVPKEDLIEFAAEAGIDEDDTRKTVKKLTEHKGWAYTPRHDRVKWLGRGA
ncbi:minichromosome maintenance protein MCM [Halobaculum sp. EA56]|uniref:minichromosome maintenance protein MCM n=1 Tax=Halobaculum sp. EA56 TaxID=3421648 RepID=UPI003EBB42C7